VNLRAFFGTDLVASISGSRESWEYGTVRKEGREGGREGGRKKGRRRRRMCSNLTTSCSPLVTWMPISLNLIRGGREREKSVGQRMVGEHIRRVVGAGIT